LEVEPEVFGFTCEPPNSQEEVRSYASHDETGGINRECAPSSKKKSAAAPGLVSQRAIGQINAGFVNFNIREEQRFSRYEMPIAQNH
jgi:hypothetical protein